MNLKIIKTEVDHKAYLAEVERLAAKDPEPGTPNGDRLELLAKLVEDYSYCVNKNIVLWWASQVIDEVLPCG